ncbi:hypothetical protein MNBD_GAMMA05-2650 [hydrothermal vent metagenome]|uniref:Uncharacterized protein n=1 Tax=hydrothermal vent metagenome TaxID=652676 RepID=A0A3B0WHD6_9ZZZZ
MDMSIQETYLAAFRGNFTSTMRWHDLDAFWDELKTQADDHWYIYAVGEMPPVATVDKNQLLNFINRIDELLHNDHDEDYCGIVYIDNQQAPEFIKIFDPNNLGVSCGFSDNPPLPGWILSKIQPVELESALNPPKNRQRWWQKIFA